MRVESLSNSQHVRPVQAEAWRRLWDKLLALRRPSDEKLDGEQTINTAVSRDRKLASETESESEVANDSP
jgi:hypothetical protein